MAAAFEPLASPLWETLSEPRCKEERREISSMARSEFLAGHSSIVPVLTDAMPMPMLSHALPCPSASDERQQPD